MYEMVADEPISIVKAQALAGLKNVAVFLVLTLVLLAVMAGYGRFHFGSLSAALDFARGEPILVDERARTIIGVRPGSQVIVEYAVTNNSGHPLKLMGMVPSCSCTTVENLPLTLAPSETKAVTARIKVSETKPNASGNMRLFTDEPSSPEIVLNYTLRAANTVQRQGRPGS